MENDLIYVYCIADTPPLPDMDSASEGFNILPIGDYFLVVKYVSENEFSEENFRKNVSDIQWLDANAREHIRVISMVMQNCCVIPFKFGTIYHSYDSLQKFVTGYSGSLAENFFHLTGMEEWAVKIYCDRKALSDKIDELSEEAAEMEKQIMASSPGKAFLIKRKKSDLVENELDRLCKHYGQEYFDEFRNLSESVSLNNLLPGEFTGRQDTMILNTGFLVSKNKVADFYRVVETLQQKGENSGFFIEATGPWPPFSFISIKEIQ
jgi:hypothetical protein